MIVRALDPNSDKIPPKARNMLLGEAIRAWIEGGDKKMGDIIVSRLVPQTTEVKRTNEIGDNAAEAVRQLPKSEREKLLDEIISKRGNSPVKADFEVV